MPTVVRAIPVLQLVLFFLFGVNQFWGVASALRGGPSARWTYIHSEVAYTGLSLVAKSMLGWMLYAGAMMQDHDKLTIASEC